MILWLINKISKLLGVLTYPWWIIPKASYKSSFNIDEIPDWQKLVIVRRSLKTKKSTFDKFGTIREDALINGLEDVPGLSLNLLGRSFKVRYIAYVPSKNAGKQWDGFEKKLWSKYIKYVSFIFRSFPIYFLIENIHNQTFPYSRPNDSRFKNFIQKHSPPNTTVGNQSKVYGVSIIKHSPAKLNYWHVEFTLLDIESRCSEVETSIIRKNIKSYSQNVEFRADITKQKWTNQVAFYALNEILVNQALQIDRTRDLTIVPKWVYLKNKKYLKNSDN